MSVTGYFESILQTWKEIKHTPTVKRDMKIVLGQFDTALKNGELEEDRIKYLQSQFKDIYNEVYD